MHFFLLYSFIFYRIRVCFILIRCSTHFLLCVVVVVVSFLSSARYALFLLPLHTPFRFATPLCNLRVDKIQGCCEIANEIFARATRQQFNNFFSILLLLLCALFCLTFFHLLSAPALMGGGGSWSTGSGWLAGYKHALKNALCVCPLRLFRLRFLHISHDFFFGFE